MDALSTSVPIVRIAASAAEADPAANVIAPVPGDRESCLAYVAGGESSLPPSYDVDRASTRSARGTTSAWRGR